MSPSSSSSKESRARYTNPTPQPPSPTNDRTLTLATSLYTILSLYLRALLASKTVDRETSDGDVYRKAANTALGACMS